MAKILTSRNINIKSRSRIAKCYIGSTLVYGAERWTLTKVKSNKLEAFEMWLYRKMLRISWKELKTNGEVLQKMKTKRSLVNNIKHKKKCQYFGHIIIIIILAVHATAGRWPPQLAPCTSILGRSHPLTANGFLDVISPSPFGSSS